jgi:hypothetical protein
LKSPATDSLAEVAGARTVVELANDYAHTYALHPGSGERGRSQLPSGGEVAYEGAHPSAPQWSMESPEREDFGGALLAFDREATSHPVQKVSHASAPV